MTAIRLIGDALVVFCIFLLFYYFSTLLLSSVSRFCVFLSPELDFYFVEAALTGEIFYFNLQAIMFKLFKQQLI